MILEDFTGKDSLEQVQHLVREKKTLEKRVAQLESTSNNWASFARTTAPSNDLKQRSTMTNFAKRSMIEQSFVQSIPSEGPSRRPTKMMN